MSKLELAVLVGKDSKQWLVDFEAVVSRFEKAASKLKVTKVDAAAADDEENDDEDDEQTEKIDTKKKGKKSAKDAEDDSDDEDDSDPDTDEMIDESADDEESEDEDEEESPKKSAKGKAGKITKEMIKDACRAYMAETSRAEVERLLKKKFGTPKVGDLDPDDYPKVMKALEL